MSTTVDPDDKRSIAEREDKILNPLNNICILSYGYPDHEEIEKEIDLLVDYMVEKKIILPRNNWKHKHKGGK